MCFEYIVSIPAGESQTMYSKPMAARSVSTLCTPSWLSASLSRVWLAASTYRLSHCLSLISAWFRLASPWMTLIRSYTTRRSQPMIRSRLRRPTSKSITAVLWPRRARPVEKLALVVVLPTPPLPEVTTTILVMVRGLSGSGWELDARASDGQGVDHELVAIGAGQQAHLGRLALDGLGQGDFAGAVDAGDGDQLGRHGQGEDAGVDVATRAGDGLAAQRCVHVDMAVGDHLGARVDHGHDHQVAATRVHLLARAQGFVDDQGAGCRLGLGDGFGNRCRGRDGGGRCGALQGGVGRGREAGGQGQGHLFVVRS